MTEKQAQKLAARIVNNMLDTGLASSTFRDNHEAAYTELLQYREDLIAEAKKVLLLV